MPCLRRDTLLCYFDGQTLENEHACIYLSALFYQSTSSDFCSLSPQHAHHSPTSSRISLALILINYATTLGKSTLYAAAGCLASSTAGTAVVSGPVVT